MSVQGNGGGNSTSGHHGGSRTPAWPKCLHRLEVGELSTNCYLLYQPGDAHVTLVDPGGSAAAIIRAVQRTGAPVGAVWLTHGHADHCAALPQLLDRWPELRVWASQVAGHWLADPAANLSGYIGAELLVMPDRLSALTGDDRLEASGGLSWQVLNTPGHTPGCLCYYTVCPGNCDDAATPVLLSGDVLFASSVGRTDLPGGSAAQLNSSLRLLADLPPSCLVLPGHGPATTLAQELATNAYLRQARAERPHATDQR